MSERIVRTMEFLRTCFEQTEYFKADPAAKKYRLEHSVRVANLCREIARKEGMDVETAVIAGLLHDVGYGQDFPDDYDWNDHGRDGARIARPFLESLELDGQTVNDICYAIAIHVDDKADFEGHRCPFTETIGDADNIDRFDAYRIYESVRYQAKLEDHTLSENLDWLRQRIDRLGRLGDIRFATPTATSLWQDRVEYQKNFFARLLRQMEASCLPEEREKKE